MGAIPGMAALATGIMKKKIEHANIPSLADMQEMAQLEGVELVACHMTVQMMEIDEGKLIEGGAGLDGRGFHEIRQRLQNLPVYLSRRLYPGDIFQKSNKMFEKPFCL